MKRISSIRGATAAMALCTLAGVLPTAALAAPGRFERRSDRTSVRQEAQNRQNTKNQWRNLAIAAGGAAAYGVIAKKPVIALAGVVGALYSLNRYEQDRKSQDSAARDRADLYSRSEYYHNGNRYERETVTQYGQKYYRFVRR